MPALGDWSITVTEDDGWMPQYHGSITHKMTFKNKAGQQVFFYMGLYQTQKQGEELINDLNRISDEKIWHSRYQREKLYNANGRQVLEQLLENNDGTLRLVWYWYHVAGMHTVNKYQAKALQVLGLMQGVRQASVVAIAVRLDGEPTEARKVLTQFAGEMGASIDRAMASE